MHPFYLHPEKEFAIILLEFQNVHSLGGFLDLHSNKPHKMMAGKSN
jgi:hypothetical protein